MHDVCGVILAGGKSRRMGRDKAMLPWRGSTFVQTIEDSMKGLFAEILVIRQEDDMRKDCGPLGGIETALTRCHAPWALFVSCDTPLVDRSVLSIFLDSDTMFFSRFRSVESFLARCACSLSVNLRFGPSAIIAAVSKTQIHSKGTRSLSTGRAQRTSYPSPWGNFPILLHKDHLLVVQGLLNSGERSLRALLKEIPVQEICLEDADAQKIRSVNTPQDYEELMRSQHVLAC